MYPRSTRVALVVLVIVTLAAVDAAAWLAGFGISGTAAATAGAAALLAEVVRTQHAKIISASLLGALLPIGTLLLVLMGASIEQAFGATLALWILAAVIVRRILTAPDGGKRTDRERPEQR